MVKYVKKHFHNTVELNTAASAYVDCTILTMVEIDISDLDIKNLAICVMNTNHTLLNTITYDTENNFKPFKWHLFSTNPEYTKSFTLPEAVS